MPRELAERLDANDFLRPLGLVLGFSPRCTRDEGWLGWVFSKRFRGFSRGIGGGFGGPWSGEVWECVSMRGSRFRYVTLPVTDVTVEDRGFVFHCGVFFFWRFGKLYRVFGIS